MFEGITFKVAEGAERARALNWRRRIYETELGNPGLDRFDELSTQLIAVDPAGDLLAGIRIQGPQQRPLEIEQFLDLSSILEEKRSPGQIGGFWVRPNDRIAVRRNLLPLGMLKLAVLFAEHHNITDLVMRTPIERLRVFYRRGFFKPLDHLNFVHPVWGLVYVMHLDLVEFRKANSESKDPLAAFLLDTKSANFLV